MRRIGDDLKKVIISLSLLLVEVGVGFAFFGTHLFAQSRSVSVLFRNTGASTTKSASKVIKTHKTKISMSTSVSTTTTTIPTTTTTTIPTTTTTTIPTTTTAAPTVNSAYANITVRVANGTTVPGLAERITTYLGGVGFDVVSPVNATTSVQISTVYYAPGFSVSAQYIASRLGLSLDQVVPDASGVPVSAPPEDINVVVGPDLSSAP